MASISALIVAGGNGTRMQADIRKQYLMLAGLPILSRTLLAFSKISEISNIYLSVPESDMDFCAHRMIPSSVDLPVHLVAGGESRQASVYNGLSAIPDHEGIVVIHDGVRPFVPIQQTEAAIGRVQEGDAEGCILGIPAVDTLKDVDQDGDIIQTHARTGIWQAQTPQVFRYRAIKAAHDAALSSGFSATDDAALVESVGGRVQMIYGSPYNIKITRSEDRVIAEGILCNLYKTDKDLEERT